MVVVGGRVVVVVVVVGAVVVVVGTVVLSFVPLVADAAVVDVTVEPAPPFFFEPLAMATMTTITKTATMAQNHHLLKTDCC